MPSTYSSLLRIELQASGENDTTWGDKTNNNFSNVIEQAIAGMAAVVIADANYTLSVNSGSADEARCAILNVSGAATAPRDIVIPALTKTYIVKNGCNQDVSVKTAAGTGKAVKAGTTAIVFCDGFSVYSASEPTADGSVTPTKLDQSVANEWRLGGAVGIGRTQYYVPNFGVLGIDGASGSRTTYYVGGAAKGELNGKFTGLDIAAAPGGLLTLSTNNATRVSIANDGAVAVAGNMAVGGLLQASAGAVSGNMSVGGTMSATGGYSGITSANVKTALGFTPVQQGTGVGQNPNFAVKLGWNGSNKLKASVEGSDLGNIMFEGTTGVFIPVAGGNGLYTLASNSVGMGAGSMIQFREVNHAGAQGNVMAAAPGFAMHWANVVASQVRLQPNGVWSFLNNPGTAQESIIANTGFFTGDVIAFYSDMRLKNKVADITDARKKLRKLDAFYYMENDLAKSLGYKSDRVQIGLSAQQVKEEFPQLIDLAPFDSEAVPADQGGGWVSKSGQNYMTVNYQRMVPVLIAALNEQDKELASLREQVSAHQRTLTAMLNRLTALEQK